jgi:hypothetical protein
MEQWSLKRESPNVLGEFIVLCWKLSSAIWLPSCIGHAQDAASSSRPDWGSRFCSCCVQCWGRGLLLVLSGSHRNQILYNVLCLMCEPALLWQSLDPRKQSIFYFSLKNDPFDIISTVLFFVFVCFFLFFKSEPLHFNFLSYVAR